MAVLSANGRLLLLIALRINDEGNNIKQRAGACAHGVKNTSETPAYCKEYTFPVSLMPKNYKMFRLYKRSM